MKTNNLTWEQIKELADLAAKNGSEFKLVLDKDTMNLEITPHQLYSGITTTPYYTIKPSWSDNSITLEKSLVNCSQNVV